MDSNKADFQKQNISIWVRKASKKVRQLKTSYMLLKVTDSEN